MEYNNDCYITFEYIEEETDLNYLINFILQMPAKNKSNTIKEHELLKSIMLYLILYRYKEDQNYLSVIKILDAINYNGNNKTVLDRFFDEVANRDPNSIALKYYKKFRVGSVRSLRTAVNTLKERVNRICNMCHCIPLNNTNLLLKINEKNPLYYITAFYK